MPDSMLILVLRERTLIWHTHTSTDARKNTDLKGKLNVDKWAAKENQNVSHWSSRCSAACTHIRIMDIYYMKHFIYMSQYEALCGRDVGKASLLDICSSVSQTVLVAFLWVALVSILNIKCVHRSSACRHVSLNLWSKICLTTHFTCVVHMRISVCFLYCLHNTFSGITDVWYYWCQMLVCLYTCVLWCVVSVLLFYAQRCYRVTCNDSCETVSATEILIFLLLHCVYMYSIQRGQGRTCRWLISLGSSASHSWRGRSARQVEGAEQKLLLFCKKNEKDASFCTSRLVITLLSPSAGGGAVTCSWSRRGIVTNPVGLTNCRNVYIVHGHLSHS
jgi:hypothetical protein